MSDVARPIGVTLVAGLMLLSGVGALIYAIFYFMNPEVSDGFGFVSNGLALLTAVVFIVLAKGILSGSSIARLIVVIFAVLQLLDGLRHLILVPGLRIIGAVQIVLALAIVVLLMSRKAATYFATT